jgi:hypothetical protein
MFGVAGGRSSQEGPTTAITGNSPANGCFLYEQRSGTLRAHAMALSEDARDMLNGIRELYVQKHFPNHKAWWFSHGPDQVNTFAELRAHGYIRQTSLGRPTEAHWMLTDFGQRAILRAHQSDAEAGGNLHHHGVIIMGSSFNTSITGSTVGAIAVGDNSTASGTVTHHGPMTQAQHEEYIKKAKKGLVEDEDQLDPLVHDALAQFLTLARKIQVEQQGLAETQAKMKAALDEVWAGQVAKGMKAQVLPKTLEVVKALMENPVMGEVTKKLVGV